MRPFALDHASSCTPMCVKSASRAWSGAGDAGAEFEDSRHFAAGEDRKAEGRLRLLAAGKLQARRGGRVRRAGDVVNPDRRTALQIRPASPSSSASRARPPCAPLPALRPRPGCARCRSRRRADRLPAGRSPRSSSGRPATSCSRRWRRAPTASLRPPCAPNSPLRQSSPAAGFPAAAETGRGVPARRSLLPAGGRAVRGSPAGRARTHQAASLIVIGARSGGIRTKTQLEQTFWIATTHAQALLAAGLFVEVVRCALDEAMRQRTQLALNR